MGNGYSLSELESIQDKWRLSFPPDLVALMRQRRPLQVKGFDWLTSSDEDIQRKLDWPLEGFLFDVRHNDLWWPEWGARPMSETAQAEKLTEIFAAAPRLIPLYGHRYLPEKPFESGNPVFSVYQSDVIYYGENLADWLAREENGWDSKQPIDAANPPKEIPFWSQSVRRNME